MIYILVLAIFVVNNSNAKTPLGITYQVYHSADKQIIHIIDIDPDKFKIISARALDAGKPRKTVPELAQDYGAVAAINGGFFRISNDSNDGLPTGVLKTNGRWHSIAYKARGAIGWSHDNIAIIDRLQTKTMLKIANEQFPIHTFNQPLSSYKFMLFSSSYGPALYAKSNFILRIEDQLITDINSKATGDIVIPSNGYIYAIGNKTHKNIAHDVKIGHQATVEISALPQIHPEYAYIWDKMPFIVGGTPALIIDNKKITDFSAEKVRPSFIYNRYARSAVGIMPNNHWVFVMAEQSSFVGSSGLTLIELADFMQQHGCVHALNLDGGGSSTMYLNNKVINTTEGAGDVNFGFMTMRKVSDAILALAR